MSILGDTIDFGPFGFMEARLGALGFSCTARALTHASCVQTYDPIFTPNTTDMDVRAEAGVGWCAAMLTSSPPGFF
jgi:hypothetical protein